MAEKKGSSVPFLSQFIYLLETRGRLVTHVPKYYWRCHLWSDISIILSSFAVHRHAYCKYVSWGPCVHSFCLTVMFTQFIIGWFDFFVILLGLLFVPSSLVNSRFSRILLSFTFLLCHGEYFADLWRSARTCLVVHIFCWVMANILPTRNLVVHIFRWVMANILLTRNNQLCYALITNNSLKS